MKPIDVKSNRCIDFAIKNNDKLKDDILNNDNILNLKLVTM